MLTSCRGSQSNSTRAVLAAALVAALGACGGGGSGAGSDPPAPETVSDVSVAGFAQFVYPASGQLAVSAGQKFQWTQVDGAASYQLQIGTSLGGSDVFDSGIVTETSVAVPPLPAGATLYARVRVIPTGWSTTLGGDWPRGTYVNFRTDEKVVGATIVSPSPGATLDADTPIAWQADPIAQGYELKIGSVADGADLLDTGTIHSTLRMVPGLPAGATVHATLTTTYANGISRTQSLSFVVGNPVSSNAGMLVVARTLAGQVRAMADSDNQPYDATPLAAQTAAEVAAVADCTLFTNTLLKELAEANVQLQSRKLAACLNPNSYDCHALAEVLDADGGRWVTLDPTLGLYAVNSQGQAATAAEISAAARALAFDQLSYTYLTPAQDAYARAYYIDYPLLFLDLYQPGSVTQLVQAPPASLEPYFDLIGSSVQGQASGFYAVQCAPGAASAAADWDGTTQSYPCLSGFTPIFYGINVATTPAQPSGVAVWRTHRFVF